MFLKLKYLLENCRKKYLTKDDMQNFVIRCVIVIVSGNLNCCKT